MADEFGSLNENYFERTRKGVETMNAYAAAHMRETRKFKRNGAPGRIGRPELTSEQLAERERADKERKRRNQQRQVERDRQARVTARGGRPKKTHVLTPEQREWALHNGLSAVETAKRLGVSDRNIRQNRATYRRKQERITRSACP